MRAARSGRRTAPGADAELLDEAIDTCETLLRDLAGAQLAIDAAARRAETSAADWQRFFEHAPVACAEVDSYGTIVAANRAAAALLSLSPKALEARLLLHFTEDRTGFAEILRALRASVKNCDARC